MGCTLGCSSLKHAPNNEITLYVSPLGDDRWSGTRAEPNNKNTDGPFATLTKARDEIRKLKATHPPSNKTILVEIQGGRYELDEPFALETSDGGPTSATPIIYRGAHGNEVLITGGKSIPKWDKVTDKTVLDLIQPQLRDKIYQAELAALGITDFGSPRGEGIELFFNDKPMWISRYPNEGFVKITGILNLDPVDIRGTKGDRIGKFNYEDTRINRWAKEKDGWVSGYWFWDWSNQKHKIARIDTTRQLMEVAPPYASYGYRVGQWFYGFNLISEIDEPGEYYVDREEGILYFYPPSDPNKESAYVSMLDHVILMNDVSHLRLENITLEGSRKTVVSMTDCKDVVLRESTIRNAGDEGVVIDGGNQNGVIGCEIYGVGAGGIKIDAGDRPSLTAGSCFAENNDIHHIARIKRVYFPGISLNGVGNRASHNRIAHLPHFAIYFNGNDHLMEYNEIYDVCTESNDAGAVYAGRNWTMRGNVIRYNYLHDISGFEGKGSVGVYLDDAFSGVEVFGNVFDNVTRAMMIGGGRDNTVLNNIFINCAPSLHIDARSMGWMHEHPTRWIREADEKGTILGIAYDQPPYSTRYPKLINILEDEPRAPKGNVISNNICMGGTWDKATGFWRTSIERKALPFLTMEANVVAPGTGVQDSTSSSIIIAEPLFVDPGTPKNGNYQLQPNSPALKHGFEQIPFDKMGLYGSSER